MDAITKQALDSLARQYPSFSIILSHQFLDGENKHECGFVPNDFNGKTLYFDKNNA